MPAPTRADLLRENIQWRETHDSLLDILADDDLEADDKLAAILDLVGDESQEADPAEED